MSKLVESLKRLYQSEKITYQKLSAMKIDGKINQEEYDYITN